MKYLPLIFISSIFLVVHLFAWADSPNEKESNSKDTLTTEIYDLDEVSENEQHSPQEEEKEGFSATDLIVHHILDDYGWHLFTYKDDNGDAHHVTIPLPVILYTDDGLVCFWSAAFHHAPNGLVKKGIYTFKLNHGHIIDTEHKRIIDVSITKNVASMMLAVLILILLFSKVARVYKNQNDQAPSGFQNLLESLIVFIRDDIAIPNIGKKKYEKYFPFLLSLFFFIWLNNLLGLIPTGANASGNIAFTFTLAVFTMLVTNFSGNKNYWGHIFMPPGVPLWLLPIMIPVEIIGIITKPFALMIRLFANITAGHIVILSLISFIFIFKSALVGLPVGLGVIVMTFLELFVAALQAYIFTLLSALFIGLATAEGH